MHDITDMNSNLQFDASIVRDAEIAFRQSALDFDGALRRFQRAGEFHEESVTDGFDLGTVEPRKDFSQKPAVFFEQFESEPIVALGQGAVAHHVGKHDGGKPTLFS
jgi:hypothetical protein